jgi:hypothetical protein
MTADPAQYIAGMEGYALIVHGSAFDLVLLPLYVVGCSPLILTVL